MAKANRKGDDNDGDEVDLIALARGLAEVVSAHGLAELIVDTKETTLTIRRGVIASTAVAHAPVAASMPMTMAAAAPVAHAAAAAPVATVAAAPDDKAHVVTSPFVGTFYRRPNPDSPNYVSMHDHVDKGSVLCIVEAMKLMNEIEADVAGTIIAILVEDGAPVEYGQPLFKITA